LSTSGKVTFANLDASTAGSGTLVVDNSGQVGLGPLGGYLKLRYRDDVLQVNRGEPIGWETVPRVNAISVLQGPLLIGSNMSQTNGPVSVALSYDGNTLAYAGISTNSNIRVWIFKRIAGVFTESGAGITINNSSSPTLMDMAMSSDAVTIAVSVSIPVNNGSVYIYTSLPGENIWTQQGPVINLNLPNCNLGQSLSLTADGNHLAASAPYESSGDGAVYIYKRTAGSWSLLAKILQTVANYLPQTFFGLQVAIVQNPSSGTITVAVGSANYEPAVGTGAAWLFTNATGSFVGQIVFGSGGTTGTFTQYGTSVCLSGNGTVAYSGAGGPQAQTAYKFILSSQNTWTQAGLVSPGAGYVPVPGGLAFGFQSSVSADGTVLAVAAPGQAVYVYNSLELELGGGRTPAITSGTFALDMAVSGDGDTMAALSSSGISVFITQ